MKRDGRNQGPVLRTGKTRLNRRTMLRGLLGGAAVGVALPMLDVFLNDHGDALADGSILPRRFGIFYWGNGVLPDRWVPNGEGVDWVPSAQLEPLAGVRDDITIVSGTKIYTGNQIAHISGLSGILAGASLRIAGDSHTFTAPTLDQVVAEEIGGATRFRSLEVAIQPGSQGNSWNGPDSRNPAESSPRAMFERIFGEGFRAPGDEPIVDPRLSLRRSVLDAVMDQSRSLQTRLGAEDRHRLAQHLEGVRNLELQVARLEEDPPNLASCARPEMPLDAYPDVDGRPQMQARSRAMVDMMAMALACDQTRVFSIWFCDPVSNVLFPGHSTGHHRLTHDEPGDQPEVHAITVQIIHELAYLVQRFGEVPEGDARLLDNCAVLGTTDVSFGRQHSLEDMPVVIAGSACGRLRTGLHYRSPAAENASAIGLTLIRAMGIPAPGFGAERGRVTEGLAAIEV